MMRRGLKLEPANNFTNAYLLISLRALEDNTKIQKFTEVEKFSGIYAKNPNQMTEIAEIRKYLFYFNPII